MPLTDMPLEQLRSYRPETTAPEGTGTPGEAGALEGLKGTTPLVELSSDFTDRLLEVDPSLTDYNYAAETYDAITLIALAVEQAQDDGIAYTNEINGLTRDGEKCTDYASCKAIIDAGGDVDYDGFSGPLEFAGNGDPMDGPPARPVDAAAQRGPASPCGATAV